MWRILFLLAVALPAFAAGRRPVTVVALHGRDDAGLDALLARQQDPQSPGHQRWLTPEEFGRRFGARPRDLKRASRWLRARGCRVQRFPNRQLLVCTGQTVTDVPPAVVPLVADLIQPDGPTLHTYLSRATGVQPLAILPDGTFFVSPADFARAYNVTPLYAAGITGAGQRIGVLGFSTIDQSDIDLFRQGFGLPALDVTQVGTFRGDGNLMVESLLDVQWSGALAPGAAITLVAIPPLPPVFMAGLARLVNDPGISVISLSVGFDRGRGSNALARQVYRLFRQAVAQGQTVLAASGDTGALVSKGGRTVRGTEPVASSTFATAVGGTTPDLILDDMGNVVGYGSESVWNQNDPVTGPGASGGGVTPLKRPSYQRGRRKRTIPDVAFPAAPIFPVVLNGGVQLIGGTSAAAPAWAGVVALLNEHRGTRSGLLNRGIYNLGRAQQAGGPVVFHDVTSGTNGRYPAGPGYDLSTGWGSIDVQAFIAAFPGG